MVTRTQRLNALIKATPEQKEQIDKLLDENKMSAYNRLVEEILGVN
jgi:hypothetical protein